MLEKIINIKDKIKKLSKETIKKGLLFFLASSIATSLVVGQTRKNLKFSRTNATIQKNIEIFAPYPIPHLDIDVWQEENNLKLKFMLNSQAYLLDWYKTTGITFLYPPSAKIEIQKYDDIYVLNPKKTTKYGTFEIEKSKYIWVREKAAEYITKYSEKFWEKAKEYFEIARIMDVGFKIENWLAKEEKKNREEVLENLRNMKSVEYQPQYIFPSKYEIGRTITAKVSGEAKNIYIFLNTNVSLNPLLQERGTATKKPGPLLELILVEYEENRKIDDR